MTSLFREGGVIIISIDRGDRLRALGKALINVRYLCTMCRVYIVYILKMYTFWTCYVVNVAQLSSTLCRQRLAAGKRRFTSASRDGKMLLDGELVGFSPFFHAVCLGDIVSEGSGVSPCRLSARQSVMSGDIRMPDRPVLCVFMVSAIHLGYLYLHVGSTQLMYMSLWEGRYLSRFCLTTSR